MGLVIAPFFYYVACRLLPCYNKKDFPRAGDGLLAAEKLSLNCEGIRHGLDAIRIDIGPRRIGDTIREYNSSSSNPNNRLGDIYALGSPLVGSEGALFL